MIKENNVEKVRRYTDIVSLVEEYFPLKRAGANYKALCPFHQENTPSFVISPDKQIFHCFGCGESGDVFSFIMQMEGVDFPEALKRLAERGNIELEKFSDSSIERLSSKIFDINARAAVFYNNCLKSQSGSSALEYLKSRGLTDELIDKFVLGFAPNESLLVKRALKEGIEKELLIAADLVYEGRRGTLVDKFRGRIIFPIHDEQGRVSGFGGRVIEDGKLPKYLNTAQTEVFEKKRILYGLYFGKNSVRKRKRIIVLEGYMDVIAAHQLGFEETAAALGTSLTQEHIYRVKRLADEVILSFDADAAGAAATSRGLTALLASDMRGRVCVLPSGTDPEDIIRESPEKFFRMLERAKPLINWSLEHNVSKRTGLKDKITAKSEIVRDMAQIIDMINDPIRKSEAVKLLAEELKLAESAVYEEIKRYAGGKKSYIKETAGRVQESRREKLAREMLHTLILKPEYSSELNKVIDSGVFIKGNYYGQLLKDYILKYNSDIHKMIIYSEEKDKKNLAKMTLTDLSAKSAYEYLAELIKDFDKFSLEDEFNEVSVQIKELVQFNKPVPESLIKQQRKLRGLLESVRDRVAVR